MLQEMLAERRRLRGTAGVVAQARSRLLPTGLESLHHLPLTEVEEISHRPHRTQRGQQLGSGTAVPPPWPPYTNFPGFPGHGAPDSPAWRGARCNHVVLLLQSLNPCSCREGGRSLASYFISPPPLPTRVNLFSFLTCEPEEFSATDNGKLLSWGWGRRRGERMGKTSGRWGWLVR